MVNHLFSAGNETCRSVRKKSRDLQQQQKIYSFVNDSLHSCLQGLCFTAGRGAITLHGEEFCSPILYFVEDAPFLAGNGRGH